MTYEDNPKMLVPEPSNRTRILIIDDEPGSIRLLLAYLQGALPALFCRFAVPLRERV